MGSNFDKTLTLAEKDAPTYLDWSDATLGRAVRETARLLKDADGSKALAIQGTLVVLAGVMHKSNAETMKLNVSGDTAGEAWVLDAKLKLTRKP